MQQWQQCMMQKIFYWRDFLYVVKEFLSLTYRQESFKDTVMRYFLINSEKNNYEYCRFINL